MKCNDSANGVYEMEHFRISIEGEPSIWIRRHPETGDYPAEVITQHREAEEAFEAFAEQCPEEVEILSRIIDGGFHAIVGPGIDFTLNPVSGCLNITVTREV